MAYDWLAAYQDFGEGASVRRPHINGDLVGLDLCNDLILCNRVACCLRHVHDCACTERCICLMSVVFNSPKVDLCVLGLDKPAATCQHN